MRLKNLVIPVTAGDQTLNVMLANEVLFELNVVRATSGAVEPQTQTLHRQRLSEWAHTGLILGSMTDKHTSRWGYQGAIPPCGEGDRM
ncbi:hypothetical protein D3C79_741660 [compost metagenome]